MKTHALIVMSLLLLPHTAVAETAVEKLEAFLSENRCTRTRTTDCLRVLTNKACASGCPRTGYVFTANLNGPSRIDFHKEVNSYLKPRRNAVLSSPQYVLRDNLSFGWPLETFLYQQVQAYLLDERARYYDSAGTRLSNPPVFGSHTVDPSQFFMLAFVNDSGAPQAMPQGDLGAWLLTLGHGLAANGRPNFEYYLRLSERVFTSFAFRYADGGVRNNKRSYKCYGDQYCYWFHSFAVGTEPEPESVLNQNLHAIRDALVAHATLADWRDNTNAGVPLPPGFTQHLKNLRDFGRGGLNQLAYGRRHTLDYPPNLRDFMQNYQNDPQMPSVKRYNAYYRYEMDTHNPANGSTPGNVCHYNYHNLELLKSILTTIRTSPYYMDDPDFIALYYKLLYGRESGDTRSCNNRSYIPPSRKVMRGLPIPEFYYGGRVYRLLPADVSFEYGLCSSALWFQYPGLYSQVEDAESMRETRAWFDQVYASCTF
jgi:hypothetical protein